VGDIFFFKPTDWKDAFSKEQVEVLHGFREMLNFMSLPPTLKYALEKFWIL